ncbi:Diacylglycerol O-acyltransferase 2-like protein 6 [Allomyces arbusculus]|nr:Diacylglycerol O-acyltransferase 2-like protein 6 [Allomyces arbusculus]
MSIDEAAPLLDTSAKDAPVPAPAPSSSAPTVTDAINVAATPATAPAAPRTLNAPPVPRASSSLLTMLLMPVFTCTLFICEGLALYLLFGLSSTYSLPLLATYAAWVAYDWSTPYRGGARGARGRALRKAWFWKPIADYFPVVLVDASNGKFTKDGNYVMANHPHGFYAYGLFFSLILDAAGFEATFPGVHLRAGTLAATFLIPFWRELQIAYGSIEAGFASCRYWLTRGKNELVKEVLPKGVGMEEVRAAQEKGKALLLVIGGAEEATYIEPGTMDLVLKKRKGFVKLALETGASLVPCISFGENDIYHAVPAPSGSRMRKVHDLSMKYGGFSLPLVWGKFLWLYPYRRPLVTVVGEPIALPKVDGRADREVVAHWHAVYCDKLRELYDQYKDVYAKDRVRELQFVA